MQEHDLKQQIETYAQSLSNAADEHHRERTADEVTALVSMSTTPNRVRRSVLVAVVLVVVLTAGTVAAVVAGSRSSSSHRTPPVATAPTNLARCQASYPAITDTYDGMNAGIRGLERKLVPIAAAKVRLCRYSRVTRGNPLIASRVLDGAAAQAFEDETNRFLTIPLGGQPTCKGIGPATTFVATYARAKQRVQIYESGCGYVTNGVLAGLDTQTWAEEIARDAPTTSVPTTTATTEACALADLQAHGDVPMPTPETVTSHIDFHSGTFAQIDPPSTTEPAISASDAWKKAEGFYPATSSQGTYEMLLGNVSSTTVHDRLAWLIIGHHVPTVSLGGPALPPGVTRPPEPPCYFSDLLQPIDATTGQTLFVETGDLPTG